MRRVALLFLIPIPVVFLSLAPGTRASGVLPGEFGAPPDLTFAFPSCGTCHDTMPNANGRVRIGVAPAAQSLTAGAMIQTRVTVTGGPNLGTAGFSMQTDRGAFLAGSTTRVSQTGDAITHVDRFNNQWDFTFQAPAQTGVVQWTAAGQSVNLDLFPTGDSFGFYGPDSAVPGVPLRLYVNAQGVTATGLGCAGTGNHAPVLGAATSAVINNSFDVDLINVPPNSRVFCALGDSDQTFGPLPLPLDLAILGANGCFLRTNHLLVLSAMATGSGSGGGAAQFRWPLPNDAILIGLTIHLQAFVIDGGANSASLTSSNALKATIR